MSTMYTIGQANQLMDALENAGFTPGEVTKLQQFKELAMLRTVLAGAAQIVVSKHIIDCDADPFLPNGWKVEKHIKGGGFEWDLSRVELFLDNEQQNGKSIVGNKLRKKLAKLTGVLNACVLDFLLAHPKLIPEEWKGKAIFFWGTIYRHSDGDLYVRYLDWRGDGWDWSHGWLGLSFNGSGPAALCK